MGSNVVNEAGKRYGRLLVVKRAGYVDPTATWLCRCDCGKMKVVRGSSLRRGYTKSCGCLHGDNFRKRIVEEKQGTRYGSLIVIGKTDERKNGCVLWLCKCDCGKEAKVKGAFLRNGQCKSCGCQMGRRLPNGKLAFNGLYSNMRGSARQHRHEWCLTKEDVRGLTKERCFYCGAVPQYSFWRRGADGDYVYNGIDRVNNDLGYTLDNVVPCCFVCNRAKQTLSRDDFKSWVIRIYSNWVERNEKNPSGQ